MIFVLNDKAGDVKYWCEITKLQVEHIKGTVSLTTKIENNPRYLGFVVCFVDTFEHVHM